MCKRKLPRPAPPPATRPPAPPAPPPIRGTALQPDIIGLLNENAALRVVIKRVRAACENDLRWVDAQPILRALEETP